MNLALVVICAVVMWTCAYMLRKHNRLLPKVIHSAAFLAIASTHEFDAEKRVFVPVGTIKGDDMATILSYIVEHFGELDEPTIDALRASIPVL